MVQRWLGFLVELTDSPFGGQMTGIIQADSLCRFVTDTDEAKIDARILNYDGGA